MTHTLADFPAGTRVVYVGEIPNRYGSKGQTATVIRPVKSRGVVTINWDHETLGWSDVGPHNLQPIT